MTTGYVLGIINLMFYLRLPTIFVCVFSTAFIEKPENIVEFPVCKC